MRKYWLNKTVVSIVDITFEQHGVFTKVLCMHTIIGFTADSPITNTIILSYSSWISFLCYLWI